MSNHDRTPDPTLPCEDESAELLLPYTQGRLTADDEQKVKRHLEGCAVCRVRLDLMGWMAEVATEHGPALFEDHVPSEQLVAYGASPTALSAPDIDRIEKHLALCRTCTEELAMLRAVDRSLAEEDAREAAPMDQRADLPTRTEVALGDGASWFDRLARWFGPAGQLSPAPAYLLVLVLLIPAYVGVRHWMGDDDPTVTVSPVQVAGTPVTLIAETERGATAPPTISVTSTGELTLLINAPISTDPTLRYDAELRDPTGEVTWRQEGVVSIDPFGTFVLILRTHDLEPGRYELALEERTIDGGEIQQVFRYPFALAGTP